VSEKREEESPCRETVNSSTETEQAGPVSREDKVWFFALSPLSAPEFPARSLSGSLERDGKGFPWRTSILSHAACKGCLHLTARERAGVETSQARAYHFDL